MARPGVTYAEVAEAASQLKGQGKNPTIEQIRLLLGTGSSTTIANHLRDWKETQSGTSLIASRERIPEELVSMVKGLWERVISQSEDKVSSIATSYQESLDELQTDLDKYRRNNQRWQNMFQQWTTEKQNLADIQTGLEKQLEDLECDHSTLQGQHELVKQQLAEKHERIEELHALHKQAQANLEHDRKQAKEQREVDLKEHHRQTAELQTKIRQQQESIDELEEDNHTLQKKFNLLEQQNEVMTSKITQLENQLKVNEEERQEQLRFNNDWRIKYSELTERLDNKSRQFFETQAEANMLAQQLEKTLVENKTLQQDKLALAQEKSSLEGQIKQLEKSSR